MKILTKKKQNELLNDIAKFYVIAFKDSKIDGETFGKMRSIIIKMSYNVSKFDGFSKVMNIVIKELSK